MTRLATLALAACASVWLSLSAPALGATPPAQDGRVVGLAFVGRMVSDLDRSVAFYKELGFSQDPAANPAWRRDEVIEHLYGIKPVETRMAKMFVINPTGQHSSSICGSCAGCRGATSGTTPHGTPASATSGSSSPMPSRRGRS